MPALNAKFLSALTDEKLAEKPNALAALNAILKVGTASADNFRQSVLAHHTVWNGLGKSALDPVGFAPTGHNPTDDANFLKADGDVGHGPDGALNFSALFKQTAIQRIKLGLTQMNEQYLKALIEEDVEVEARKKLVRDNGQIQVGQPPVIIHDWQTNGVNILDVNAIDDIQLEAQRLFLSKKIAAATDKNKIDSLLTAWDANDNDSFRTAARALGVPATTVQKMDLAQLGNPIKVEAAKKGYELLLSTQPIIDFEQARANLREADAGTFLNNLVQPPYRALLTDADAPWLRELYGKKYLTELFSSKEIDSAKLTNIASQPDVNAVRALLKENGGDDAYLTAAVTDKNLPSLRQVAAVQALNLKIAELTDVDTLSALTKLNRVQDIKRLLATNNVLGYKNTHHFQEAFINDACIKQIVAAASVRQTLLNTSDPNKLQSLLLIDPPGPTATDFLTILTGAPSAPTKEIENYFKNPANVDRIKKQALENFVKFKIKGDDASVADAIVTITATPLNKASLKAGVNILLGKAPSPTDSLIENADRSFRDKLRAYAAIEATLRITKNIDLTDGKLDAFKTNINQLNTIASPTAIAGAATELNGDNLNRLNAGTLIATLPVKEQEEFRGKLVEILINNYPALNAQDKKDFKSLIEAKDFLQFKQALRAIGITSNEWVSKESMAAVQTAASKQLIKANFASYSNFTNHSALLNVVEKLPLVKQKAIVGNPDVIRSLMDARSETEIQRVLGSDVRIKADPITKANPLSELARENSRYASAAKIVNSEVARIIGNSPSVPSLNAEQVKSINAILLATPDLSGGVANHAAYKAVVDEITKALGLLDNTLEAEFGYNAASVPPVGANGPVDIQQQHNAHLLAKHNQDISHDFTSDDNVTEARRAILQFAMSLKKENPFPDAEINNLYKAFSDSETVAEFIQKIKDIEAAPTQKVFNLDELQKQLTPEMFNEVKAEANKAAFIHYPEDNVVGRLNSLKNQRKPLEDLHKEIASSDKKIHKQLKQLSETRAIDWLNPGFQSSAKQNAREMLTTYTELDKACETMVRFYEREKALLQKQLASLPEDRELAERWRKNKIADTRTALKKQIKSTEEELDRYIRVQQLLRGNPDDPDITNPLVKEGILKTLEAAKKGGDIQFIGCDSTFQDYPKEQKNSLLRGSVQIDAPVTVKSRTDNKRFITEAPIPEGHVRLHTLALVDSHQNRDSGQFLVEKGHDTVKTENGKIVYLPNVTVTIGKGNLPKDPALHPSVYMEAAKSLLSTLNGPPSKENPIWLDDGSAEMIEGVWLALMVIGQKIPDMKFDSSAVRVGDTFKFNPAKYVRSWGPLGESITHPKYKELVTAYDGNLSGMKQFSKEKFGEETRKAQKITDSAAKAATQHYRQTVNYQKVETEVKKDEKEASTLSGVKMGNSG
ncbi:hypothetical protein [Legionella clemsonensis]|uniref:Interaptin n=1 Tax=Legionella clemsonensis TaxID=1867846 RepID=A0A222P4R0_9GAMM|nr:hypothetical protein [Legionella clemsonensis]ASQ46821.1 hypothetical protein clem_11420 [Legionella clemsonensis]